MVCTVGAAPTTINADGVETLELLAQIPDPNDPVTLKVRAKPGSKQAELLKTKNSNDRLLLYGSVHLEESLPVITPQVISNATNEQFINEVTLVGNLSKPGRETDKTVVRSVAHSRPIRKGNDWEERTDWFLVRGYENSNGGNSLKDRLIAAPKGSLVEVSGTISQRTSKTKEIYVELKARKLRVHKRGGGGNGGAPNPAEGLPVVGYEPEAFTQDDEPMPSGW